LTAEVESTSVVEIAAPFAVRSGSIVETAGAHSGTGVTCLWVEWVHVVVAFTLATHAVRLVGVSPVGRSTFVTHLTCISFKAVAYNSVEEIILSTSISELSVATRSVGTHAWFALVLAAQKRVAIVTFFAHFAMVPDGVSGTAETDTSVLVANVSVSVAVASGTFREAEVARFALVASSSRHTGLAQALAAGFIAEVVAGASGIAIARSASSRAESISTRSASITSSSNHVGFAHALTAPIITDRAFTTLWVAVA